MPELAHSKHNATPARDGKYVIGVCAMDSKSRSKPMRNILNRLVATGKFEVQMFGDKVVLDEDISEWPACNFLISFFSCGFPLDKAIEYVKLRRPYLVNDLILQKLLFDRRVVLAVLDKVGVPTARRVLVNRDNVEFSNDVVDKARRSFGFDIRKIVANTQYFQQQDKDTLVVDGITMTKPFVEKPVSGEDHNIYVYYHSNQGGGCRKLFRKIANKSSEYCPEVWEIRTNGSFIYEEFMDADNATDVKVYTIGPSYAHAETRKSPVVDGIVQRNQEGKEIRYITQLTEAEKEYSKRICVAFGQTICGFDLLRADGSTYVIDVNGWSFVKGNEEYYDKCCNILASLFENTAKYRKVPKPLGLTRDVSQESQWRMKGFFSVIRHGDRTPKLKKKFNFLSAPFQALLNGEKEEVILKKEAVNQAVEAAREALRLGCEDAQKLAQIQSLLDQKVGKSDTKVQVKPTWNKATGELEKLQVIVKWGGEFTHAGKHHSYDLGENLRKDLSLFNKALLSDVVVYSASEQRVIQTAEEFTKSFLEEEKVTIRVRKEMLDDSNAAKEQMEQVKKTLQNYENIKIPGVDDVASFIEELMVIMRKLRDTMEHNFAHLNVDEIQPTWCCNDTPHLFKERWSKLFKDFCDSKAFDPSKVSDLYDSLKYDALHNWEFVTHIFSSPDDLLQEAISENPTPVGPLTPIKRPAKGSVSSLDLSLVSLGEVVDTLNLSPYCHSAKEEEPADRYPAALRSLFRKAKKFFDVIGPAEYGLRSKDKLEIGLLTCQPLMNQILQDLQTIKTQSSGACTRLYFTKESHVHTLLNIIFQSGLPTKVKREELDELDYLTQITFELYERNRGISNEEKDFSVRCSFSPGAYCAELVDLKIGVNHSISAAPKRDLTDHLSLDEVMSRMVKLLSDVIVDEGTSPTILPLPPSCCVVVRPNS